MAILIDPADNWLDYQDPYPQRNGPEDIPPTPSPPGPNGPVFDFSWMHSVDPSLASESPVGIDQQSLMDDDDFSPEDALSLYNLVSANEGNSPFSFQSSGDPTTDPTDIMGQFNATMQAYIDSKSTPTTRGVSTTRWPVNPFTGQKIPRVPSVDETLAMAGYLAVGQSYDSASPTQRNTIKRAYAALDKAAMERFGSSFRYLSPTQQKSLADVLGGNFQAIPDDDPEYRRLKKLQEQEAVMDARLIRHHNIRAALDQPSLYFKQPPPLKAEPASRRDMLPNWQALSHAIPQADLNSLIAGWSSGDTGLRSIAPIRLRYLMSLFPVASTPTQFLNLLLQSWANAGSPGRRTPPQPTSRAAPYSPNIRFRRPH